MVVSLVDQDRGLGRRFLDELAHFILGREAGGRIVRVADINEPFPGRGAHFGKIVSEARIERDFHCLRTPKFRVLDDRFKGWIGHDQFAASDRSIVSTRRRSGEGRGANLEDLAGARAQENLISIDAVVLGERLDQQIGAIIGIAAGQAEGVGHCL